MSWTRREDRLQTEARRAHLVRVTLATAHLVAILASAVALAGTGLSATSGAAIAAVVVLTMVLMRTPRVPPHYGAGWGGDG